MEIPATGSAVPSSSPEQGENPLAPAAESAEPKYDPGDWATRFAGLSKKERKLLDEQRRLKAEREEHGASLKELEEYRAAKANGKKDPMAVLKSLGLTYEDVTQIILNDNKLTPEQQIKQLQDQLDADREARESEKSQSEKVREQKAIEDYQEGIKSHVATNSDKYELIHSEDAHEMVFEVIEEFWNENGKVPDLDLACQHVEEYLTERARKIMGLKKFAPPKSEQPSDDKPTERQPSAGSFTLTNQQTAAPAQTRREYLSDAESKRQAAAMLRWN